MYIRSFVYLSTLHTYIYVYISLQSSELLFILFFFFQRFFFFFLIEITIEGLLLS